MILGFCLRKISPEAQNRRTPIILLGMVVWFIGLMFGIAQFTYWRSAQILPQLQNYLVEAAAAKLKGDSIIAGHPVKDVSWTEINSAADTAGKGLKNISTLSLARKMDSYKNVSLNWSNDIAVAAKNTNTWKKLAVQPADFKLSLNESMAKKWFKESLKNIYTLKEFGDEAIKRNDKETMYYIAAKLLVQKHWINAIAHSEKANLLALKIIEPAAAVSNSDSGHPCYGTFLNCMGSTCAGNINCEAICTEKFNACAATTPAKPAVQQQPTKKIPANQPTQPKQLPHRQFRLPACIPIA